MPRGLFSELYGIQERSVASVHAHAPVRTVEIWKKYVFFLFPVVILSILSLKQND